MATLAWVARAAIVSSSSSRPVMRLVVVDVEQPEELGCRRGAAPCTGCRSPPGRPRPGRPRRAGRRGSRPRRAAGERRRRPPTATAAGSRGWSRGRRRQAAADLGHRIAVLALEEDRRAVALEQDHRVVDQAGQDAVEVEPAADVAGDPAQRLGAVEQVGDLVGALGAADDRTRARRPRPGRSRRLGCPATRGSRRR